MQAAIGAVLGLPCLTTSPALIHPKRIETSSEAEYAFGLCNILWQRVPEFNYALCMKKKKKKILPLVYFKPAARSFLSYKPSYQPLQPAPPWSSFFQELGKKVSLLINQHLPHCQGKNCG